MDQSPHKDPAFSSFKTHGGIGTKSSLKSPMLSSLTVNRDKSLKIVLSLPKQIYSRPQRSLSPHCLQDSNPASATLILSFCSEPQKWTALRCDCQSCKAQLISTSAISLSCLCHKPWAPEQSYFHFKETCVSANEDDFDTYPKGSGVYPYLRTTTGIL